MRTIHAIRNTLIVTAAVLVPSVLLAGPFSTPHSFTAGTAISSADVNENFTAVETAMNGHDHFADVWTGTTSAAGLDVSNTSVTGFGLYGESAAPLTGANGWGGVRGNSTAADGGFGVVGTSLSTTNGGGVIGEAGGTSVGVIGYANGVGGTAVRADYEGSNGVALEVHGAVKVTGTTPAAFVHTSTVANSTFDATLIDNPLSNGDPNAMVIVTHSYGAGANAVYVPAPIGVYYTGTKWAIYREDQQAIPTNAQFNVLVIKR